MRSAAALVLVVLVAAGCAGPPERRETSELDAAIFTIGYAPVEDADVGLAQAAQLAVDDINAQGGVGGAVRLELEISSDPAPDAARNLVLRGVQALMLSCDTRAAAAMADVADRTQVLAIAPCNDDPRLPLRYPTVWPASLPANAEAAALADYALAQRYEAFTPVATGRMLEYVRAAAAARGLALDRGPALGTHAVEEGDEKVVAFTTFGFPEARSRAADFYRRYEQKYGLRPRNSGLARGYDAVRVLAAAIEAAGSADPDAVAAELEQGLVVEGAYGEIVYPGAGARNPEVAVVVVKIDNDRRSLAEKSLPEDIPPP